MASPGLCTFVRLVLGTRSQAVAVISDYIGCFYDRQRLNHAFSYGEKALAVRGVEPIRIIGDPFVDLFGPSSGGICMIGNAVTLLSDLVTLIQRVCLDAGKSASVTEY